MTCSVASVGAVDEIDIVTGVGVLVEVAVAVGIGVAVGFTVAVGVDVGVCVGAVVAVAVGSGKTTTYDAKRAYKSSPTALLPRHPTY